MGQKAVKGAKPAKKPPVKPSGNKPNGGCGCETFEQCMMRQPYGVDVWSGPKKSQAMGCIAYSEKKCVIDNRKIKPKVEKALKRRRLPFYAELSDLIDTQEKSKVMVFPAINEGYIQRNMGSLAKNIHNTADFTNFQKSMILRANLVRNGMVMKEDPDEDIEEEVSVKLKELLPYCGEYTPDMWSVDHIRTRTKGGCNRFCNAMVITFYDNQIKSDKGPGCPCICPLKEDETPGDGQKVLNHEKWNKKRYELYECTEYFLARENNVKGLPDKPSGICDPARDCKLDNPCEWPPPKKAAEA